MPGALSSSTTAGSEKSAAQEIVDPLAEADLEEAVRCVLADIDRMNRLLGDEPPVAGLSEDAAALGRREEALEQSLESASIGLLRAQERVAKCRAVPLEKIRSQFWVHHSWSLLAVFLCSRQHAFTLFFFLQPDCENIRGSEDWRAAATLLR
jgi:hypothetical protein